MERRVGIGATNAAALIRRSVDVVRRDSLLCLGRPPARNPHAGSDDDSPRARRFVSPRAPTPAMGHAGCRASLLAGRTPRAIGPAGATSIANTLDSRNPPPGVRTSCRTGPLQPPAPSRRRATLATLLASSMIRPTARRCSTASGSISSNCASASNAVTASFSACCAARNDSALASSAPRDASSE